MHVVAVQKFAVCDALAPCCARCDDDNWSVPLSSSLVRVVVVVIVVVVVVVVVAAAAAALFMVTDVVAVGERARVGNKASVFV